MIGIILVTVFAASFFLAYGVQTTWARRQRVKVRAGEPGPMAESVFLRQKGKPSGVRDSVADWLALSGRWALPDLEKISEMRKDLIRAGYRHPQAPAIYLGLRIMATFVLTMPLILFLLMKGALTPATLLISFCLAGFGFFLPVKILAVKIKHRQEHLDKALPDIVDMFVICMEAGLSLNASLQRVSEEIRKVYEDFSDELQIVAGELRAGIPWAEAFDNMGKRTDVQSIRSMVGLMVQSNKLGTSIGEALRHHSEFIRTQRVLRAEERAAKLPLKMIFPLIFCIFPAIIIVVAGPGIIHILEKFLGPGGLFQSLSHGPRFGK
jgi:tight adherence protein C